MIWLIVILCIVLLVAALAAIAFAAAWRCDRHFFGRRLNGNPLVRYFEAKDFVGLSADPVRFKSYSGVELRGFWYTKEGVVPKAVVVFAHGYGAGHLAYTTEIDYLAGCGYAVLAFDMTGCGESGGGCLEGFDQGPLDLSAALDFVVGSAFGHLPVLLVGHSWGAFSVLNTLPAHPEVAGAVAMCGFVSGAAAVAESAFRKRLAFAPFLAFWLRIVNRRRFGKDANFDSIRSLQNSRQPLLLLYGGADATIRYATNGARIRKAARGRADTEFLFYPDKGHNVYLSAAAEKALHEELGSIPPAVAGDAEALKAYYASLDYRKLTEEDPAVMQSVSDFLGRCLCARKDGRRAAK